MVIYFQIPTIFSTDGRNISVSYWMYLVLMKLGRQKFIHLRDVYLNILLTRLKLLLKSWKHTKHQVLIKFREKWPNQEVTHYVLRSTNLLILLQIKKESIIISLALMITERYHSCQLNTKFCPISLPHQCYLHTQIKLLGITCVDLEAIYQLRMRYSVFVRYLLHGAGYSLKSI